MNNMQVMEERWLDPEIRVFGDFSETVFTHLRTPAGRRRPPVRQAVRFAGDVSVEVREVRADVG